MHRLILLIRLDHGISDLFRSYPVPVDTKTTRQLDHHSRISLRMKSIINDKKIFSDDFDRDTTTKLLHYIISSVSEKRLTLRDEWHIQR